MASELKDADSPDERIGDFVTEQNIEEVVYPTGPTLENIPVEIFLEICSYLDPGFISHTLSIVCKRFEDILADDSLWRYWVNKKLRNNKYPPINCPTEHFRWDEECVHIDRLCSLWKNEKVTMKHVALKNAHYASVDGILLLRDGTICVSGGRDRAIAVWDVKSAIQGESGITESVKPTIQLSAHEGWVWALASPSTSSNRFFSASWDSYVKCWDLNTDLVEASSFKCALSVLCITCVDEHVAVAGLYSPEIVILDTRVGDAPVASHRVHKASVLDITHPKPGSHMLFTTSEDRTLAAFDMRAGLLRRRKHLNNTPPLQPYALSLAANNELCPHALYAGDTHGNLHLFDMRTLQKLSITSLWAPEKGSKVNSLALSPAGLFACSEGGSISIMNPSFPPNRVATITSDTSSITALDYENDVLTIGTCDAAVELWVPLDSPLFE